MYDGELSVFANDILTLVEEIDSDWIEVTGPDGSSGMIARSYVEEVVIAEPEPVPPPKPAAPPTAASLHPSETPGRVGFQNTPEQEGAAVSASAPTLQRTGRALPVPGGVAATPAVAAKEESPEVVAGPVYGRGQPIPFDPEEKKEPTGPVYGRGQPIPFGEPEEKKKKASLSKRLSRVSMKRLLRLSS